ncbi:MAG TPA: hypothetical protein VFK10_06810 [Burkholderiaceae bacterium]|nr:hypothetical protein [Burkholderiaceae bacterium]
MVGSVGGESARLSDEACWLPRRNDQRGRSMDLTAIAAVLAARDGVQLFRPALCQAAAASHGPTARALQPA